MIKSKRISNITKRYLYPKNVPFPLPGDCCVYLLIGTIININYESKKKYFKVGCSTSIGLRLNNFYSMKSTVNFNIEEINIHKLETEEEMNKLEKYLLFLCRKNCENVKEKIFYKENENKKDKSNGLTECFYNNKPEFFNELFENFKNPKLMENDMNNYFNEVKNKKKRIRKSRKGKIRDNRRINDIIEKLKGYELIEIDSNSGEIIQLHRSSEGISNKNTINNYCSMNKKEVLLNGSFKFAQYNSKLQICNLKKQTYFLKINGIKDIIYKFKEVYNYINNLSQIKNNLFKLFEKDIDLLKYRYIYSTYQLADGFFKNYTYNNLGYIGYLLRTIKLFNKNFNDIFDCNYNLIDLDKKKFREYKTTDLLSVDQLIKKIILNIDKIYLILNLQETKKYSKMDLREKIFNMDKMNIENIYTMISSFSR